MNPFLERCASSGRNKLLNNEEVYKAMETMNKNIADHENDINFVLNVMTDNSQSIHTLNKLYCMGSDYSQNQDFIAFCNHVHSL